MGFFKAVKKFFGFGTNGPRWTPPPQAMFYFSQPDNWKTVTGSTNIVGVAYFSSVERGVKSCLGVRFLGSGQFYVYDCPISYLTGMLAASSRGTWFWENIRRSNIPFAGPF